MVVDLYIMCKGISLRGVNPRNNDVMIAGTPQAILHGRIKIKVEGSVTVIGDTHFALNKNLEGGAVRLQQNINFWRWLLTRLRGEGDWIPPKPPAAEPGNADREEATP